MNANHLYFLIAAYTAFSLIMLWDFFAPRLRFKSIVREAKSRLAREQRRGQKA